MKFFVIMILTLSLNLDAVFAAKKIPIISGRIVDSSTRSAKPIKFAKVKVCSTTRNVTCNEYQSNEDGKYFAHEIPNDTYNIHVNGVMRISVEVKTDNVQAPVIIIPGGNISRPSTQPKSSR